MPAYTDPDVISDEGAVAEQYLDQLAESIEGWVRRTGQVEPQLAEATGLVVAPVNALLIDTLRQDYQGWGETILGVARIVATAATGRVSIAFSGAGTVEEGTQLAVTMGDGDQRLFYTTLEVTADTPGMVVTEVPIVAAQTGADGNGGAGAVQLIDAYEFVSAVEMEGVTSGAEDEEDRDAYNERLARRARRFLGIPATVADTAAAATDVPGVARALAINFYNPATPDTPAPGHVTVVALEEDGMDVSSDIADDVIAALAGPEDRLLQVVPHVAPSTPFTVAVAFEITTRAGRDGPTVLAAAEDGVRAYLDRGQWGYDEDAGGLWTAQSTIFYLEVAQAIQEVEGVDKVTALTINGGETNLVMPGIAPLPDVDTVDGTLAS